MIADPSVENGANSFDASTDDAVTFSAHALGLNEDDYYEAVNELASELPGNQFESPSDCHFGWC